MAGLPEQRSLARELPDLLEVERGRAEHALDLVWLVLFDLQAEVDFPALVAGTFILAVLAGPVLWGDSERVHFEAVDGAVLHGGGHCYYLGWVWLGVLNG
jgi:hypothetical protein